METPLDPAACPPGIEAAAAAAARSSEFDPVLAALAEPEEDAAAMAALRILFIWGGGDALPESRDA